MGFSMGDMNDFISQPSFRGVTFDYRKMVTDNVGVGVEFGWNVFYEEKDYATYTKETGSISGKQFRYCSAVPMLASADYYFSPGEKFSPFAGIGIGTQFTSNELDMGVWALTEDTWHFLLKPEVGVILKAGPGVGVSVTAKYYHAFETKEVDTRSFLAANVGLTWGF
jgi:opacity protein-like surface antigen